MDLEQKVNVTQLGLKKKNYQADLHMNQNHNIFGVRDMNSG